MLFLMHAIVSKPDPVMCGNIEATMIKMIDFISYAKIVVCEFLLGDV